MAKVLLVEDDNNLREIYEARLQAEGYEISSAQDGEQALVVAKQFKPDLIISDVMMPKISGFEMLDILRNTEGLEHTRVIMLTALGQAEDKTRADALGADRYLVKSQVTLEDIVKSAHEILDGDGVTGQTAPAAATEAPAAAVVSEASADDAAAATVATPPVEVAEAPELAAAPADTEAPAENPVAGSPAAPAADDTATTNDATPADEPVAAPAADPVVEPPVATEPAAGSEPGEGTAAPATTPESPAFSASPAPAEPSPAPETPASTTAPGTAASEQQTVNQQIEDFIKTTDAEPVAQPPSSAPASDDAGSQDEQLLAEAAESLSDVPPAGDSSDDTPPSPHTVITPTEPAPAAAPTPEPEAPTPPAGPAPSQRDAVNDAVTITHKKVIQPPEAKTGPSLDELLAREEARESGLPQNPVAQPGNDVVMPPKVDGADFAESNDESEGTTPPASPKKPDDFDPNNIAL